MGGVLLVDDNRVQQLAVSKMLFHRGLGVIVANDGIEALKKVQCYCPSLVILDIVLPRMNGYEVCRRIKKDKRTQSIPVVMFTAKSEEFDFYWGSKQGADAYVSKLSHPRVLIDTVNQLLHDRRMISSAKETRMRSPSIDDCSGCHNTESVLNTSVEMELT